MTRKIAAALARVSGSAPGTANPAPERLGGNIDPGYVRTTRCASGTPAVWQSVDGTIFKLGC